MKLRNFAGAVLALAFTACGVRAFAAGGDITEIWPVGETDLVPAVTPVSTATYPLKAGDTVRFAIRLGKRNPTDRPWRLAHISAIHTEEYDAIFNPMKIGIYVSGVPHYATFDGELPYDNYTDFYFTYTVQHGDFALPVVLAVGTSSPKPAVGDKLRETEYYFEPKGAAAWQFNNSALDNPGSGERATMSFKQSVDIENPDYDLRGAGFYVKTIDFEGLADVAAGKPWRSVEAGTTKCDQTPRLAVDNYTALTNPVTLYVWSLDESVVRLTGAGVKPMQITYPDSSTRVERQVLTAKLNAGDSDFPFKLEAGDDAEGKTTQLVLCAFPDFTYAPATEVAYEDYTTATVAVTPKSDPYMTLTKVGDEEAKRIDLKATSDYYASTALQLQFSQPYTNGDVKVSLRQFFGETEATAEDDVVAGKYLSFHLDPDADPTSDPSLEYVTVPKGSTEPVRFYVFALGSSVKTRKSPYLTLKPDLYADQPEAVTNFFAAGRSHQRNLAVKLDDQAPVIVQPKADTAYTAGAGSKFTVGLQISDNWRDLQESWATNGYSVTVEGMGVTKFTTNAVHFADGDLLTIEPTASEEGGEAVIRVTDPEGHQAETITISVNVIPRPRAEVLFYTDSTRQTRHFGDFYEHDPAKPYYLDISFNKGTAPANMYAFLVPQDVNASNLVQCAAVSNGLYIAQGYTNSENAVAISFLDGFAAQNPMSARFKVLFKSTPTIDDSTAVDYTDGCGNPTVTMLVQNVPSTVPTVKLDTESIKTGGTFYNVPAMIAKKFRAKIADLSEIDLKYGEGYEGKEIWVRFEYTDDWNGWEQAPSKNLYATNGLNNYAEMDVAFTYEGTVQRVNVYALDKDSRAAGVELGELEWGDPLFTFYVSVAAPQRVIIHDKQKKAVTDEDELVYSEDQMQVLSTSSGDFYISLSSQPGSGTPAISKDNPIRVKVTLEQYGDGVLDIQTNYVYYTTPADMALKPIRINTATLNGGRESVWWMTAAVDMEDPSATDVDGNLWSEHFAAASCMVRVNNVDPVIDSATAKGARTSWSEDGTNSVTVGEAVTVSWTISDITNDFYKAEWKDEGFQIEWGNVAGMEGGNPLTITNDWPRKKGIGSKGKIYGESKFQIPDRTGAFQITMTVTDGDGGRATKEWWVYVAPAKRAKIGVFGPRATAESKYKAAKGVGQGLVAAKGTLALCEQFAQTWEYDETTADAEFYAFGYPATNTWAQFVIENPGTGASANDTTDSGKLPGYLGYETLNGVPLNRLGNYVSKPDATTVYYDWATHGGLDKDAGRYDSYFYRWMVTKAASGDKETVGDTPSTPSPTFWPFDGTSKTFTLDTGNAGSKDNKTGPVTYGTVGIEAIFSRELRERDNLGDINADGIPDKIVELYGLGAEEVGAFPENDLDSLSAFNDDEDYLPNTAGAAIYSSLIPGLPGSWGEGLEFTARLEVRGFHDGLNDGAKLAGLGQYRFDADYDTVRDYSDLEQMAWEEHGKAKDWSPERPTDPTKEDTDEDKFPDGYEYYFWYKAHVGYLENGVHRYLTGRAYDPRNPGEGKFISAATIARIMDPRSDLKPVDFPANYIEDPTDAKTRDTDKDGLPDLLEFEIGTNPFDFDTDGDGLPDGFEIMIAGTDPLKAYTMGSIADGMRNFDGDAMAFTTPELEEQVLPKPLHIEVPFTFALVEDDGDTDGVQWYVSKTAQTNVVIGQSCVTGTVVIAAGKTFVTSAKTVSLVDGRLTADLPKESTWEAVSIGSLTNTYACLTNLTETGYVAFMPTRIAAGSLVKTNAAAYATLELGEEIEDLNAAWVYGSKTIPTQTTGDNLANQGGYGMLAVGRYRNAPAKRQIAALPKADKTVAYLHYLVYQEFGFDPRTAWNANTPLAARWGTTVGSGENQEVKGNNYNRGKSGYAGIATRTREFTTYDEFLLFSFFLNNGMDVLTYEDLGDRAPSIAELWYANTTNPQGPTEEVNASGAATGGDTPESEYWGRNDTNGADTDGDGVPDGWELYVMAGPKNPDTGKYVFAMPYLDGYRSSFGPFEPDAASATLTDNSATSGYDSAAGDNDGLTELQEFAGTDSCAWYALPQGARKEAFSTTIVRPEEHKKWLNKFFPTDPWNEDTDGDGLTDGNECKNAKGFNAGNFLYGDAIDTGKTAIPGGGLNPCAMDTDLDGLPDPWEAQFAGKTIYTGEGAQYVKGTAADGSEATSSSVTLQGLCDGMDGTVFDAYNSVYVNRTTETADRTDTKSEILILNGVNQVVDRDYDKDGLENWQEYLVGAMRCWRYDDPFSDFGYIASDLYFDALGNFAPNYKALGIETEGRSRKEISDEFWYKTLFDKASEIYNPHLVTDQSSGAQYFTRVRYGFDPAFTEAGTYYILYDRVGWNRDGTPTMLGDLWGVQGYGLISAPAPKKYISCDPTKSDTDQDGMDDYYELFHGMNPLLGADYTQITSKGGCDIVYDAWYDENFGSYKYPNGDQVNGAPCRSLANLWIAKGGQQTGFAENHMDFVKFPWLNGLETADPDGDDIRNQAESIMAKVAPTSVFLHTDPTPLWMTDSSYTNSLVYRFFRLPTNFSMVSVPETITVGDKTIPLYTCDGYTEGMFGPFLAQFLPDYWSVAAEETQNWIASFEENEGYDSDHDVLSDYEEFKGNLRGASDPQDFDSPHRRQAMYFPGKDAALQSMPFVAENHPRYTFGYPDDMSFLQYTVECWVKPESAADATVIERGIWTSWSNPGDQDLLRKNFQVAVKNGKWYTKFDSGTLAGGSVEVQGETDVEVGKWTHVAATYDAQKLILYVNGVEAGKKGFEGKGLIPEYGSSAVVVHPGEGTFNTNGFWGGRANGYWFDKEYSLHAFLIGASFKGIQDLGGIHTSHLNVLNGAGWSRYKDFFKGYIDEVRVWDGARSSLDIKADMKVRYTAALAKANRDDFYDQWAADKRRYDKDGSAKDYEVIPELRYHWSFDSVPGAANAEMAAKVPLGYAAGGVKAPLSRPADWTIGWWSKVLAGYGSVYSDPTWVTWVPNTVTHLPRFDGTTLDSFYWSDDFMGDAAEKSSFAHTAEPVSRWTQYVRNGLSGATTSDGVGMDFESTGRRFWLANVRGTNEVSNLAILFEFTGRHLNQQGDDLLPLGGAFAKYCDDMWDEQGPSMPWEVTGEDANGNGLPDWWEEYAKENYLLDPADADNMKWTTLVDYNGRRMTAGQAYLYDLNRGLYADKDGNIKTGDQTYAQKTDEDKDGMPDWWEEINGLHNGATDLTAGGHADDDPDNDGLSNYQEYLASTVYGFYTLLNPVAPRSGVAEQKVTDYYLPVDDDPAEGVVKSFKGEYLGLILTDHDFMEDWWENKYAKSYANAKVYDPWDDTDGDGWSNFAECRATLWGHSFMASLIDGWTGLTSDMHVTDYPEPIIGVKVTYEGQSEVGGAQLVIRTQTSPSVRTDATFLVPASLDSQTRYLGEFEGGQFFHGHLSPGHLNPNSVVFERARFSSDKVYQWNCDWYKENEPDMIGWDSGAIAGMAWDGWWRWSDCDRIHTGDFAKYREESRKWPKIELEGGDLQWEAFAETQQSGDTVNVLMSGKPIGVIDATTGEFALDMTRFAIYDNYSEFVFRVTYTSRIGNEWPQTVYVSDTKEFASGTGLLGIGNGRVREGLNTIEAFFDLNGNGTWDVGEPYGAKKNVQVGWHKVPEVTIELTDKSKIADGLRTTIVDAKEKSGAGKESNDTQKDAVATAQKVRVVRESINGQAKFGEIKLKERTVMSKEFVMDDRAYLTEADVVSAKKPDLDWQYLLKDAAKCGVTSVDYATYRIESYDVLPDGSVSNTVIGTFTREFEPNRPKAAVVSPKNDAHVYSSAPTFRFTAGTGATAFEIQIAADDGTPIYDSGIQMLGGRTTVSVGQSAYAFTAPVYIGASVSTNGAPVFENGKSYKWRVVAFNAKFCTAALEDYTEWESFRTDVSKANYGSVGAVVRYFGPAKTNDLTNLIVVEAYANADFTGQAMAQTRLTSTNELWDVRAQIDTLASTNALLTGVDTGTVYLRAYIDLNNNGQWDKFEPWGYANEIGTYGSDRVFPPIYNPKGITVTASSAELEKPNFATIFIEDTDWNKNEIPDCLEDIWDPTVWPLPPVDPETAFEIEDSDGGGAPDDWEEGAGTDPADPEDERTTLVVTDVMAYEDIEDVLLVRIGTGDFDAVWYAVMDLDGEGMKLRDSDIPLETDASAIKSLYTTWNMTGFNPVVQGIEPYVGIGRPVSFEPGDAKVLKTTYATVRLVHAQVYAKNGFNALTANAQAYAAGESVNTKPFTVLDKYLVCRYRENIGVEGVSESNMLAQVRAAKALSPDTETWDVWRRYTLDPNEIDGDHDDIDDGWELYVMFGPGTELKISPWNTADGMLVAPGADSQLKLVEEFDGGYLPTDPWSIDTDHDGVIDFYAYQYHLKGDDAGKDIDGDGLSNYAEYLITEVFQYAKCDPEKYATSDGVCDYFRKVGDLYLGEIFTDHDQVGDEWEDGYQTAANRYVYDPDRDDDNDGWSNYAEFRAGTNPSREISLGADEYTFGEFPIPLVEATVVYNGSHPLKKAIVFKAWNEAKDADMLGSPDAVWSLGTSVSGTDEGTGAPSDSGSALIGYTKYCGRNTGDLRRFNLTGGAIAEGSVRVCFRDNSYVRTGIGSNATEAAGANWYVGVTDKNGRLVDFRSVDVGSVDYATGLMEVDFSKLIGSATGTPNSTSEFPSKLIADRAMAGTTGGQYYDTISLDDSAILLKWDAMKIGTRADGTYYLADADAISDEQPSLGHLREGKAVFVCFSDEDGNGKYTVGEPYGFVRGVDVGWQGAKFTVELTEASPVFARVDLYGASASGDSGFGGSGEGEKATAVMTDRMFYWGTDSGDIPAASYTNLPNEVDAVYGAAQNEYEHVRIVPYLVGGIKTDTAYYDRTYAVCYQYVENRVVAEFDINRTTKPCITEADFIRDGQFDIDWDGFLDELWWDSGIRGAVGDVTAVKYRIVFGKEGPVGRESNKAEETEKVRAFSTLIERRYEPKAGRTLPTQLKTDGVVHGAQPTFKWRLDENVDIPGYSPSSALFGCSYTAFQIEVYSDTNAKVYDSGLVRAPARDANGFFTWTAPLYAGDQTDLKAIFAKAGNWKWRVAMYNAKFRPGDGGWSAYAEFSTSVDTQQEIDDHNHSAVDVAVKYAGPVEVLKDCADLAKTEGKVRIQAFTSADFSGEPVAQGFITDKSALINAVDVTANGRLIGLPEGIYYIRAYIDSNGNFVKDDFESWGYAKEPVIVPDASRLAGAITPVPAVWIEDADTDQDWLPDAWEYAKYGNLATEGAKIDPEGKIVLKKTVYDGLLAATTKANFSQNRSGASLTFFQNIGNATLLLGLQNPDVTLAGIADIRAAVEKKIEEGSVKITSLVVDATNGKVILTVGARTTDSIAGYMFSPVYEIPTSKTVTINVYRKANLATGEWPEVPEKSVDVTITETLDKTIEVPIDGVDFNSGFYKVEIVEK